MFIIVDLGALIIFLAILGIGLGYTIISNIGPILFMITSIIAFLVEVTYFLPDLRRKQYHTK